MAAEFSLVRKRGVSVNIRTKAIVDSGRTDLPPVTRAKNPKLMPDP